MNESLYWPSIGLACLNFTAVVLWLATLRLRFVLAMRARAHAVAGAADAHAHSVASVEHRLAEDIRRWRATHGSANAAPLADDLEPWIAEVELSERHSEGGRFLPRTRRDSAGRRGAAMRNAESAIAR